MRGWCVFCARGYKKTAASVLPPFFLLLGFDGGTLSMGVRRLEAVPPTLVHQWRVPTGYQDLWRQHARDYGLGEGDSCETRRLEAVPPMLC